MKKNEVGTLDLSGLMSGLESLNGKAESLESFGFRGQKVVLKKICIKEGCNTKVKPGKIKKIVLASSIGRGIAVKALREVFSARDGVKKKSAEKTTTVTDIKKSGNQVLVETTTSIYEVK